MGEKSDQIEREIRQKRNQLSGNFDELEQKVKHIVDWRAQFEEHPGAMVAMAFGGGVLLSALFSRPVVRQRVYPDQGRPSQSQAPARELASVSEAPSDQRHRRSADTNQRQSTETRRDLAAVRDAFVALALTSASGVIDSVLPGFQSEFMKARVSHANSYR